MERQHLEALLGMASLAAMSVHLPEVGTPEDLRAIDAARKELGYLPSSP